MVSKKTDAVATNTEYDEWGGGLTESVLGEITSFEDALAKFGDVPIKSATDLVGDGFTLVKDKLTLVGKPFLILRYRFHMRSHGTFVTLHVMTKENEKLIINDGSTGIASQIQQLDQKMESNWLPMAVMHGLRFSDYEYEDKNTGDMKGARTFYLDASK